MMMFGLGLVVMGMVLTTTEHWHESTEIGTAGQFLLSAGLGWIVGLTLIQAWLG